MKKFMITLIGLVFILTLIPPALAGVSQSQLPDEAQITAYLNQHPLVGGVGAQVLSVTLMRGALIIDLSEAVLPAGVYDPDLFAQIQADLDQAFDIDQFFMTNFKVEGKPLEFWGHPLPSFEVTVDPPGLRELPGDGPLAGVKIALNPGHGLYWNETYSQWMYQRIVFDGIREDTLNLEIMRYVQAALANQGATVIQLREFDLNARTGVSGYPAWHEGTREYAIAGGLPSYIYNGSNTNYNSDIRARPYMANYYGADLLISLHNNGWNGTLTGTETYYDVNNNPRSYALANAVHSSIIQTIRTEYDSSWTDRNVRGTDWIYGEVYYAQMPAVLIELAFMDTPYPDNAYLRDEAFKQLAAKAITKGICTYLEVTCENTSITMPNVIETPTLTPAYGTGMCNSGWYRYTNARGQYAYLALNAEQTAQESHQAAWQPSLPINGEYRLEVFIPEHNAVSWSCPDKTISSDARRASYEIIHANGVSTKWVDQVAAANTWVDLGIFYFNDETPAQVKLTNVTGEISQTTTVSASAMRFTLVGQAGWQFYNTPWVENAWLTADANTPVDHIRNFFILHRSCLADPIADSDGTTIDLPELIYQASSTNQINPKVFLAIIEAEQSAISQCPNAAALASLMGQEPATTARDQIASAGTLIKNAITTLAATHQTPNGWVTGAAKVTLDNVSVIPANDTITTLFDYEQNAGAIWGGSTPDINGVQGIYTAWRDYLLNVPLPQAIHYNYFTVFRQ